jgi:transglutaminase-like putative cysteine protease
MKLNIVNRIEEYLEESEYVDFSKPCIQDKSAELKRMSNDEIDLIRKTYYFVRDEINHAWDVGDQTVTAKASEVLQKEVGICWAKSNLLAALLRANGIPAGFCYQKLTLKDTPEEGYIIHALNAVYIKSLKFWIRLDARGNKEGVNADMRLSAEQLAFPVRANMDEIDYEDVLARPWPRLMQILEDSDDVCNLVELPQDFLVEELVTEGK